jgi:hypothetical protein
MRICDPERNFHWICLVGEKEIGTRQGRRQTGRQEASGPNGEGGMADGPEEEAFTAAAMITKFDPSPSASASAAKILIWKHRVTLPPLQLQAACARAAASLRSLHLVGHGCS